MRYLTWYIWQMVHILELRIKVNTNYLHQMSVQLLYSRVRNHHPIFENYVILAKLQQKLRQIGVKIGKPLYAISLCLWRIIRLKFLSRLQQN